MTQQPWDPGLQVERTALAWIRTSLAIIVVALVTFRFATPHGPPLALALGAAIAPLGLLSLWLAWRRYRTTATRLHADRPLPGGLLALTATVVTTLTGVLGLAYVVLDY